MITILNLQASIPKYVIYDDACHLGPFCKSHINTLIPESLHFSDKLYVVDKLHMKGHTGIQCKQNNDPALFPDLDDVNTVICEQINFWLGKFKYILKHMNFSRFYFFLFIIFDFYNSIKIQGLIDIADCINFAKTTDKFADDLDSDFEDGGSDTD